MYFTFVKYSDRTKICDKNNFISKELFLALFMDVLFYRLDSKYKLNTASIF